jgi:hypothetical protein
MYRIKQKYIKHTQNDKTEPKEHHYTATLHYTSPNYTSQHLSTLHYRLIWFNTFTFPTALFHLTPSYINYARFLGSQRNCQLLKQHRAPWSCSVSSNVEFCNLGPVLEWSFRYSVQYCNSERVSSHAASTAVSKGR